MNATNDPITILLADPNVLFRSAMVRLLDSLWDVEVLGETGDGLKTVDLALELRPEVILSEVELDGCDGPTFTGLLKERFPAIHVVFLTADTGPDTLLRCVFAGASGFLHKQVTPGELFMRLRGLRKGEAAMSLATVKTLLERLNRHNYAFTPRTISSDSLSSREREVITLVARGFTNKKIGMLLSISEYTVRNHLVSICAKLGVSNRLQVAIYGVTHGLVDIYMLESLRDSTN